MKTDSNRLTGSYSVNWKAKNVRRKEKIKKEGTSNPFFFCRKSSCTFTEKWLLVYRKMSHLHLTPDTACTCESLPLHSADKGLDRCWYECDICCPTIEYESGREDIKRKFFPSFCYLIPIIYYINFLNHGMKHNSIYRKYSSWLWGTSSLGTSSSFLTSHPAQ